jgi:NAD(P)-dependent dehydrogenase (short-subunit alcohol dehydrogenase family)
MKRAIIIGATSGLGREIAMNLVREGWSVGVAGRRVELLDGFAVYERIDVTTEDAVNGVERLVEKLGGMDLFVNVAGVGFQNPTLDPKVEKHTFDVNGYGFMRMVDWAYNYFKATRQPLSPTDSSPKTGEQYEREGHIAIISSIAGTKPLGTAVAYSATKRMQSHYLTGLAQLARMEGLKIRFTDIRPGFAATDILNPNKHYPMMMSKEYAGRLATKAILKKKRVAIIDWKFAVLTFFWSLIPRFIWERLTFVKN